MGSANISRRARGKRLGHGDVVDGKFSRVGPILPRKVDHGLESNEYVPSSPLPWIYHISPERAHRDLQDAVLISARINFWHLFWFEIGPILTLPSSLNRVIPS